MVESGRATRGTRGPPAEAEGGTHPRVLATVPPGSLRSSAGWRRAADFGEAEKLYRAGRYDEAVKLAAEEIRNGSWLERWHLLKVRAELARGLPRRARLARGGLRRGARQPHPLPARPATSTASTAGTTRPRPSSTRSRTWSRSPPAVRHGRGAGRPRPVLPGPGGRRPEGARPVLRRRHQAPARPGRRPPRHRRAGPRQAGRRPGRLHPGEGPQGRRRGPPLSLPAGPRLLRRRPRPLREGGGRGPQDQPRHVDSLLLLAEHRIDDERYAEAGELLEQALEVNPREPRAWAYRAVLAHLRNDPDGREDGPRRRPWPDGRPTPRSTT